MRSGGGTPITRAEAWEAVQDGADNVMCGDYFEGGCDHDGHEGGCWVGLQKGDGDWPEHWRTFELW